MPQANDREVADLVNSLSGCTLLHTPGGQTFARFLALGHRETWPVLSSEFRGWLTGTFFGAHGKAPTKYSLDAAISVVEAQARFDSMEVPVHIRIAEDPADKTIWVDLWNDAWEYVHVTPAYWKVIPSLEVPDHVVMRRAKGMGPLPTPIATGASAIAELPPLLNARDDVTFTLMISWLVGCLNPKGPYPVMIVQGEQGSAKSSACRMLRRLIDPNAAPLRNPPRSDQDLFVTALQNRIVALENLSGLTQNESDSLCRLATGAGFGARKLYTDDEESVLDASRPILVNGIDDFVVTSDLLDRSIAVQLPSIPENERQAEIEIWPRFKMLAPRVLGELLDGMSAALRRTSLRPSTLPRMADFAVWVNRAESALPWGEGHFMRTYMGNRRRSALTALSAMPVVRPLVQIADTFIAWEGTITELLSKLTTNATAAERRKDWPSNVRSLNSQLRRLAPALRAIGVQVEWRDNDKNYAYVTRLPEEVPDSPLVPETIAPDQSV